jgi:tripartite-type tricarboxylate transporter receptor subunit TctC
MKRKKIKGGMEYNPSRRSFLKGAAALSGAMILEPLLAYGATRPQDFPTKPLNHIGPAQAGGGFDRGSRIASIVWEKKLGVPIQFSYLPGGSTLIGLNKMLTMTDGYTTSITSISMLYLAIEIQKPKFGWEDLAFLGTLLIDPNQIMVHKDAPWKTAMEFVEAGRKAATPLKISTSHPNADNTLAANVFIQLSKINAEVVAFDGGSAARNALAGKHVDACCGPMFSSLNVAHMVRGLVVFQEKNPVPDLWKGVQPAREALDFNMPNSQDPFALFCPKAVVQRYPDRYKFLVDTFRETIESEEIKKEGEKSGMSPFLEYWSPEKCQKFVDNYDAVFKKYGHLMKK